MTSLLWFRRDPASLNARSNARRAGIGELVTFEVKDVAQLSNRCRKARTVPLSATRRTASVWKANRR
jgi:hypothetical protein